MWPFKKKNKKSVNIFHSQAVAMAIFPCKLCKSIPDFKAIYWFGGWKTEWRLECKCGRKTSSVLSDGKIICAKSTDISIMTWNAGQKS